MLGREKSSGEEYLPEPEAPERPREAAFDMEAKEAVDEINESSLTPKRRMGFINPLMFTVGWGL